MMPTPPPHQGPRCSHCLKWKDYLPIAYMTESRHLRKAGQRAGQLLTRWRLRTFCSQACSEAFTAARPEMRVRELV